MHLGHPRPTVDMMSPRASASRPTLSSAPTPSGDTLDSDSDSDSDASTSPRNPRSEPSPIPARGAADQGDGQLASRDPREPRGRDGDDVEPRRRDIDDTQEPSTGRRDSGSHGLVREQPAADQDIDIDQDDDYQNPAEMASWTGQPSIRGTSETVRMILLTFNTIGITCVGPLVRTISSSNLG